jgi:hypothetical protein
MRRITYLQKVRSSVVSTFVLSIPKLNAAQTRRLVRKCDSSGAIGITRGHVREGNSRNYSTAPAHKDSVPGNQDAATNVGDGEKKK